MAKFQELQVKVTASIGDFKQKMRALNADLTKTSNDAIRASRGFSELGRSLTFGVTAPLAAFGATALKTYGDIDALKRGLIAVTGSAEETERQFKQLREVAKLPGLGFKEAIQGAVNLQAVGFSAEQSQKILLNFGKALANVGRGREDLNEVIRQLGQMASRGKVTADNLKPILERVPQIGAILKKEFGTIDTEVLQKMGVSAEEAIDKIIKSLEQMPGTTSGIKNEIENLRDSFDIALYEMGKGLEPFAKVFLENFANPTITAIGELGKAFAAMPGFQQNLIVGLAATAAAAGPAIWALTSLVNGAKMLGPLFLALGAPILKAAQALTVSFIPGATAAATSVGALSLALTGLTVGVGAAVFAIYKIVDAYSAMRRAQQDEAQAGRESAAARERTLKALKEQAPWLEKYEKAWRAGAISTLEFDKALRAAALEIGKTKKGIEGVASASVAGAEGINSLSTATETAKIKFVSLKEALDNIQQSADLEKFTNDWISLTSEVIDFNAKTIESRQRVTELIDASDFSDVEKSIKSAAEVMQEYADATQQAALGAGQLQFPDLNPPSNVTSIAEGIIADQWDKMDRQARAAGEVMVGVGRQSRKALLEVSTVITDLSRGITKLIFEGGKFRDVMKNVAREVGEALVRNILQKALKPIIDSITTIVGKLPGLAGVFSGGGNVASSALPGSVSILNPVARSAGGAVSGASSAASTGLMGTIGVVSSVVSAISSVISNFQLARQENTLNAIEESTRYTKGYLRDLLPKLTNDFASALPGIHDRLKEMRAYGLGVFPQEGYNWAMGGGATFNISNSGMVYGGPSGIKEFTDLIVAELRRRGVRL